MWRAVRPSIGDQVLIKGSGELFRVKPVFFREEISRAASGLPSWSCSPLLSPIRMVSSLQWRLSKRALKPAIHYERLSTSINTKQVFCVFVANLHVGMFSNRLYPLLRRSHLRRTECIFLYANTYTTLLRHFFPISYCTTLAHIPEFPSIAATCIGVLPSSSKAR